MINSVKPTAERKKVGLLILLVLTAGGIYFRPSSSSEEPAGASKSPAMIKASLEGPGFNRQATESEALPPGKVRAPSEGKAAGRDFRPTMKHNPRNSIDTERFDPTLRTEVLDKLADVRAIPAKRSLFDFYTPPAPPQKLPEPVVPVVPVVSAAAAPPPRPPIQLRFYGQEIADGGGLQRVFCELNDQVMIPSEGAVLERRYKIRRISAASVVVEDLQYHNEQTLPIQKVDKPEKP